MWVSGWTRRRSLTEMEFQPSCSAPARVLLPVLVPKKKYPPPPHTHTHPHVHPHTHAPSHTHQRQQVLLTCRNKWTVPKKTDHPTHTTPLSHSQPNIHLPPYRLHTASPASAPHPPREICFQGTRARVEVGEHVCVVRPHGLERWLELRKARVKHSGPRRLGTQAQGCKDCVPPKQALATRSDGKGGGGRAPRQYLRHAHTRDNAL
jgi:hypothetical protein